MSAVATTATAVPPTLHPGTNTTTINKTIVQLVLGRLTQPDAFHAAQVCKDWLATVQHHLLRATLRAPASLEHVTTRFASLERLAIHNVKGDSGDFKHIARLQHLQSLTLDAGDRVDSKYVNRNCKITGLEALASMCNLSQLTLRCMVLNRSSGLSHVVCKAAAHQGACHLAQNKGALLELTLHACRMEAPLGVLLLGQAYEAQGGGEQHESNHKHHKIPKSSGSSRNHARYPVDACQLQLLDLSHFQTPYPCAFKGLGRVTTLRTLVLRHVEQLDDDACIEIAKLTDLHSLDLTQSSAYDFRTKLSHRGVEALCRLPNLESLVLQEYAWLSNTAANMLCNLHASLTHLDLRQSPMYPKDQHRHLHLTRDLIDVLEFPDDLRSQQHSNHAAAAAAEQGMQEDVQPLVESQPQQQQQQRRRQVLSTMKQQVLGIHQLLQRHEREGFAEMQKKRKDVDEKLQREVDSDDDCEYHVQELMYVYEAHNKEAWAKKESERKDLQNLLQNHDKDLQEMLQKLDHQGRVWAQKQQRRICVQAQEQQRHQQSLVWSPYTWDPSDKETLLGEAEDTVSWWQQHLNQKHEQEWKRELALRPFGEFTSSSVQHIAEGLPRLQSLVLSGDAVDRDACGAISHALPALTTLELVHCQALTDDALCLLEPLTMLRTLSLVECDDVTDTGVKHVLEACRMLQHVRLAYTPEVTSLSMEALHGLPLVSLDLSGNLSLNDEVLAVLVAACPLLEMLVLDDCHNITDTGVCAVATHALQLRRVSVEHCSGITVRGLCALAVLPRLEHVNAYGHITRKEGLKLPGVEVVLRQPSWWMIA